MFQNTNRKTKIKVIGYLLVFLVVIPLIIHCLYKFEAYNEFFIAEWSAGDFLSYYGAVLSFIATVILSVLALWQNEIIRNESNKHTDLLLEMEHSRCCPFFKVAFISEEYMHSNVRIKISNITENIALNVRVLEKEGSFKSKNRFNKLYEILNAHDSVEVILGNGFMERNDSLKMEIQCENVYGNRNFFHITGKYNFSERIFEFNVVKVKK